MICPKCCAEINDKLSLCPYCNFDIEKDKKETKTDEKSIGNTIKSTATVLGFIIILGSFVLLLGGIFTLNFPIALYAGCGIIVDIVIVCALNGFGELINDTKDIKSILKKHFENSDG